MKLEVQCKKKGDKFYHGTGHRDRSFTVGQGTGTGAFILWDRARGQELLYCGTGLRDRSFYTVGQGTGTGALL